MVHLLVVIYYNHIFMPEEELTTLEKVSTQTAQPYETSPSHSGVAEKIAEKRAFIAQTIEGITKVRTSLGMETTDADMPPSVTRAYEEIEALEKESDVSVDSYSTVENTSADNAGTIFKNNQNVENLDLSQAAPLEAEKENPETDDSLKEKVLSGEMTIDKLTNALIGFNRDNPQYTPEESLEFLQDTNVAKTFLENEFSREKYNELLSIVQFQCAETYAIKDSPTALSYLEQALNTAQLFSKPKPAWSAFVQGTILYLLGKQIPQGILDTVSGRNKTILTAFNQGLAMHGEPRYARDYPSDILG